MFDAEDQALFAQRVQVARRALARAEAEMAYNAFAQSQVYYIYIFIDFISYFYIFNC
jgi:hypothetical protein